jgi:hypothetical protein
MTGMRGSASKDLRRRVFGTAGGRDASCDAPEWFGEAIDPEEEILRKPVAPPVPQAWKPRAGSIYNFPVRRVVEEK